MKLSDIKIRRDIIKHFNIEPKQIITYNKEERDLILRELKKLYSVRQIERVTGVSRGVVYKSCHEKNYKS